ncbi:hypothetical protein FRC03_010365 [Tulasnella sp. 419]|nr:hypothetical protein FRC03_010365 [Tulasnella sp. 419]
MATAVDISHLDLTNKVEFGEQISHGGYSDIFQGTYSADDGERRQVAIKALRLQGSSGTPAARDRLLKHFYREVLLWQRFRHPSITPLLGYTLLADKPPALVSPWYIHGNVLNYLEQHSDADRNALALDVITGLEYLHSFPIAHGDLKGENVLVDGNKRASLCDFGMSQFLDEANRNPGFTTTNAHLGGTDRYMCPELLEDMPKTTATDIWALGCLLVQIIADEIPYQHITRRQAVLSAIVQGHPPSPNRPDVITQSQWDCVTKCWNIIPGGRPLVSELCSHFQPKSSNEVALSGFRGFTRIGKLNYSKLRGFEELSPDGKYLAASDGSEIVVIWEVDKPIISPLKSLVPPNNSWWAVLGSWSSIQKYFMVVYKDAGIGVWDVEAGVIIRFCSDNINLPIYFTGRSICAYRGSVSESIHIVDLATMATTSIEVGEFIDFALTPDLQRIVLLNEKSLSVHNINGQCEFVTDRKHPAIIGDISISKDGQHVLISHDQGPGFIFKQCRVDLWEITVENGRAGISHKRQYYSPCLSILLGPAKPRFGGPQDSMIVAIINGTLSIWDRFSDKLLYSSSLINRDDDRVTGLGTRMSFRWNTTDPRDMVFVVNGHVFRGLPRA